jgi:transcriptional regulator with XRE-family HTH domain
LGAYIKAWRMTYGITQMELARRAEIGGPHVTQIESGKIGLPSVEVRRRLAQAMGVSHLDLLMAAGEISADEIQKVGVEGVAIDAPEIVELVDDLRAVELTPVRVRALRGVIHTFREGDKLLTDPANGVPVTHQQFQ